MSVTVKDRLHAVAQRVWQVARHSIVLRVVLALVLLLVIKRFVFFDVSIEGPAPCAEFGWRERADPIKVWDVFPVNNELDMVEARLEELKDVADHVVIIEAPVAFSGKPKPLYFSQNKERFKRFMHKITHIVLPDLQPPASAKTDSQKAVWRKIWQKNGVLRGLFDAHPEDLVVLSDLDEVPRREVVEQLARCEGWTSPAELQLDAYMYDFGCLEPTPLSFGWRKAKIVEYRQLSAECDGFTDGKACFDELRDDQHITLGLFGFPLSIRHAGWHMSYFLPRDKIIEKIQSYAHVERNTEHNRNLNTVECYMAKGTHFNHVNYCNRRSSQGVGPRWAEEQAKAGVPAYKLWYDRELHPEKCDEMPK